MEASSSSGNTVLYNPFLRNDRLHFPSFIEAFGHLLQIEQENLKKLEEEKDKQTKTKTNPNPNLKPKSNPNPPANNSPLKSIDINIKSNHSTIKSTTTRSNNSCTPIPMAKKKKRFIFSNSNHPKKNKNKTQTQNNFPSNNTPNTNNFSNLPITPIPRKQSQPQLPIPNSALSSSWCVFGKESTTEKNNETKTNNNNNNENSDLPNSWIFDNENKTNNESTNKYDIMVTPMPKTKATTNTNEKSILMMADIMSPIHANQLNSPAPNDKNAQLLTKPVEFSVCMPPTPMIHGDKNRIAMEERKNNEFFKNHKPLLTPAKLRENQIQLYNPQCDFEATMLLGMMPTPYDDDSDNEKESNAFTPLDCDLSMISPIDNNAYANNNSNHLSSSFVTFGTKMQNSFHNSNASNKNLANVVISPPFTPINENEPMEKIKNNNDNNSIQEIDEQFSTIKLNKSNKINPKENRSPPSFHKSLSLSDGSFKSHNGKSNNSADIITFMTNMSDHLHNNSIKITRENTRNENTFNDDSFLSIHPLSDSEFFSAAGGNELFDQSTQTNPVLIFDEHDIPKITYNGKLIDTRSISNKNDSKIVYADNMYDTNTPVLRHNKDSIHCQTYQYSDSDNEINHSRNNNSRNNNSRNKNKNKNKKKESGDKMLRQYKQSKLAQNPNWSISANGDF